MPKKRKRMARVSIICDWCGVFKMVSRKDAATCSGRCRQRMAKFVAHCGYRPEHIPGPMTAADAIELEIERFFRMERDRRAKLAKVDEWTSNPAQGKGSKHVASKGQ